MRVFEFHEDQGAAFYSMQYVDGAELSAIAGQPLSDVLPAIGLLADALRYAHSKGVVHRDVKADNVLLDYNGAPYLGDFGVAAEAKRLLDACARQGLGRTRHCPLARSLTSFLLALVPVSPA